MLQTCNAFTWRKFLNKIVPSCCGRMRNCAHVSIEAVQDGLGSFAKLSINHFISSSITSSSDLPVQKPHLPLWLWRPALSCTNGGKIAIQYAVLLGGTYFLNVHRSGMPSLRSHSHRRRWAPCTRDPAAPAGAAPSGAAAGAGSASPWD